ncbi:MAG: T9SS type A sorting domain-containing protein [Candidatus Krumholzibacteriota bacterium]
MNRSVRLAVCLLIFATVVPVQTLAVCLDYGSYLKWKSSRIIGRSAGDLVVHNGLVYVSDLDELSVVDITDPSSMPILGRVATSLNLRRFTLDWPFLYAAVQGSGIAVFDVSDPTNPLHTGTWPAPGETRDVAFGGGYLYAACRDSGVQVFDLTFPEVPTRVGGVITPGITESISVTGNFVCVSDTTVGLQMIDVTDPLQPVLRGDLALPTTVYELVESANRAYLGTSDGLLIADISDPEAPALVSLHDFGLSVCGIVVSGERAYLAADYGGFKTLDLVDPALPELLGVTTAAQRPGRVALAGTTAFVIDSRVHDSRLMAFDVSVPETPVPLGYCDTDITTGLAVAGDYAYVVSDNHLRVVDVADPTAPNLVAATRSYDLPRAVCVSGHLAFLVGGHGMNIVDISIPTAPVNLGRYDLQRAGRGVAVDGNYAYVSGLGNVAPFNYGSLEVFDVTDPSAPVPVSYDEFLGYGHDIEVQQNIAYLATFVGLRIYDISDPGNPALLSEYESPIYPEGVTVVGDLAYLAADNNGLEIVDVSDPTMPHLVCHVDTPGEAKDVVVFGGMAYVADYEAGVTVIDVLDPSAPSYVGMVDFGGHYLYGTMGICVDGEHVYAAGGYGLMVLPRQCAPSAVPQEQPLPQTVLTSIFPNPANPQVSISFTLDRPDDLQVQVYDLSGRHIATVASRSFAGGDHLLHWNGRTHTGAAAPSGAYLIRLKGRSGEVTSKVMLVR